MAPQGSPHRLGTGTGATVQRTGLLWNDVLLPIFPAVLLVACVGTTIGLEPGALLLWPVCAVLSAYTVARRRDQSLVEAHLDGTVLSVRRGDRTHHCDLSATGDVRLGTNITAGGDPGFYALSLRDTGTGKRFRYVLRTDDAHALSSEDLGLLAAALEASPPSHAKAHQVAARLRRIERDGHEKSSSETVDWSHRISSP
ncbi:hypothetical protein [Spirillospora sp. NPDC029432]|uniref:hypothetical protein n=1 Tax=Spirillospora sp. NPDC029432 TaxID=3154599 RepID=UPI0034514FAC